MSDMVNHPQHYTQAEKETIDEMVILFGYEATINFCVLNAYKYKVRAPFKGKMEEDLKKADWYINKAEELKEEQEKLQRF